jgi:PAS domain-containing protein
LVEGRVGVAQVRELARARSNPRCGDRLVDVAKVLLEHAQRLDFSGFRQVVHRWETLADADGAHRSEELTHERRDVTSGWVGPGWQLHARHGTTQGVWMAEVFNAFERAELLADVDAARTRWGCDDPTKAMLDRSAAQRRADALFAIFTAAAGAPPVGVPAPTVNIVVDPVTFDAALTAAVTGEPIGPVVLTDANLDGRCCQTTTGIPITPAAAVAAAIVGYTRRAVIDADGVVINLGRRVRLFTGSAREAVWIRRMHCIWVGCRSRWCDIDHRVDWDLGGATDQDNGDPMCRRHHHLKQTGLQPRWHPDHGWRLHRPDGTHTGPI